MVTAQAVDVEQLPALTYAQVMGLAETECERVIELAAGLESEDWKQPTDCDGWTVRDVLGHLLGMWQLQADPEIRTRQMTVAAERCEVSGKPRIDELTAFQVECNAHLSDAGLVAAMRETAPSALAARRGLPEAVRLTPYESKIPGEPTWTMGYLFGIIHTRDPWLHRIDICRATGREPLLDATHDGRIVTDVVREWFPRHGTPLRLSLTGPAGGEYRYRDGTESLSLDAVEFCRVLSGRGPGTGPLAVPVTF